jgi:putative ABC transport system permease protein
MNSSWQDLRYGARILLKKPGFTLIAVLTLALGIGANTAIFTVINALLFRPLPYPQENQIVVLQEARKGQATDSFSTNAVSYLNFKDWQSESHSFESMAIVQPDEVTLTGQGEPARVQIAIASSDLFKTLGVTPMMGRDFSSYDEIAGSNEGLDSVVLSFDCWKNRFESDSEIVGQRVTLDAQSYIVIGVMPAGIFPLQQEPVDFWITPAVGGDANKKGTMNGSRGYRAYAAAIARLKSDVTIEQSQAEMSSIAEALSIKYPDNNTDYGVRVTLLRELLTGKARSSLWLLSGIVGAVLLIACANVANLLLVRASTRKREIAIRAALGASRLQLIKQLLTESLLLSLAGGVMGVLLSLWGIDLLMFLLPADLPRISGLTPDWRVILFTFGASLFTGIVCGLVPALAAAGTNLIEAVKEGGRSATISASQKFFRQALVTGQIAIALTLLIAAGLLVKSFVKLQQVDPGFDYHSVMTAKMVLSGDRYKKAEQTLAFYDSLRDGLKALPGVTQVSFAQSVPMTSNDNGTEVEVAGRPVPPDQRQEARLRFVSLDYFQTVGIARLNGRDFTERDNRQSPPVVIINEAFARQFFSGEDPIGKKLNLGWGGDDSKEVIGIVSDVRHRGLSDIARPEMYVPHAQFPTRDMMLLVRTDGNPESLISDITRKAHELDPELPVTDIKTLSQYRSETVSMPRFNTAVLAGFASLALLLSIVGLYGLISYSVAHRTSEFGIRMALGAQTAHILRMVLIQGLKVVASGILIGLIGAIALTRIISGLLFEVSETDPLTFTLVSSLLVSVALLACLIPARRAAKTDPIIALRYE